MCRTCFSAWQASSPGSSASSPGCRHGAGLPRHVQTSRCQAACADPAAGAGGDGAAPAALAELGLACGRRLRARLVVGADGPRSYVRQLAGARPEGSRGPGRGVRK